RMVLAATSGRQFMPDVEAELVIDASSVSVAPTPVAPAPVAPAPVAPAPAPARAPRVSHRPPSQLPEPSPRQTVDGLFADDHGLGPNSGVAHRRPGADLQAQIDDARRRDGAASIGGGDPRVRGDDRARTGTGPDCACVPNIAQVPNNT